MSVYTFTVVVLLIFLVPEGSSSQNALEFPNDLDQPCNKPTYIAKIHLTQTGYAQSVRYGASVPDLTKGFTAHFWLKLDNAIRNATVLSYALGLNQLDTVILKYAGADWRMPFWELSLNGTVVFQQTVQPLKQGEWNHITATWNAYTNTWALFQNGGLCAEGTSLQVVDKVVSGGGVVAIGADQTTLKSGMDMEQGVVGWITYFYMHSKPIQLKEYFQRVWPNRCSVDKHVFNDVIDWVQTPRKLVGGVTEVKAKSSCGYF